ncbi:hypothetical protein NCPPB3923_30540, partial [Burkholderia glumae]
LATIVHHHYATGVSEAVSVLGSGAAAQWVPHLAEPRVLVDPVLGGTLLGQLRAAGLDGPALLEAARRVMVQSIHIGIALAG